MEAGRPSALYIQRDRPLRVARAVCARVSALRGRGWVCVQVWRHVQVRGYWEAGRPPDACDATAPAGAEYALRVPPCAGVPECARDRTHWDIKFLEYPILSLTSWAGHIIIVVQWE